MADSNGSSVTRVEVYESLFVIAQATEQIAEHLERLRSSGMLSQNIMELQLLLVRHMSAEVATSTVHNLTAPEVDDAARYEQEYLQLRRTLAGEEPEPRSPKQ